MLPPSRSPIRLPRSASGCRRAISARHRMASSCASCASRCDLPVALDPFVNKKLFDDQVVLLARSDHPSVNVGITTEDLRTAEFVTLQRRSKIGHAPPALEDVSRLIIHEVVRVSELLEIPTVVASTDLLGIFLSSMGPLMAKRLGLRVLPIPLELPPMPIYMIWHETRRYDTAHRWLREVVVAELSRLASS